MAPMLTFEETNHAPRGKNRRSRAEKIEPNAQKNATRAAEAMRYNPPPFP